MNLTRRQFLAMAAHGGLAAAGLGGCGLRSSGPGRGGSAGVVVNDIHSGLNETRVARVVSPTSADELAHLVRTNTSISIAGGRHAMGGQQFGEATTLIDTRSLARVLRLDTQRGIVEVEAGIQWPQLVDELIARQPGVDRPWSIIQKQTGANRLCLGGALSANIHGRALNRPPIVSDVESFTLVDGSGEIRRCSRTTNADLFRLAIGGYGLFGVIATVELRLARRRTIQRIVDLIRTDDLPAAFDDRIAAGFGYGDFQFAVDRRSAGFLRDGVFSCYRPAPDRAAAPDQRVTLSIDDWQRLILLAHVDPDEAYRQYARFYLATSGQLYESDLHQFSDYVDGYHHAIDREVRAHATGSEMITEIYVPRRSIAAFLAAAREDFLRHNVELIYGTVRLVERDEESFLAWAREPWACTIFNLHIDHTPRGLARSRGDFRRLIDLAIRFGGSYYLTYHRWATRRQVEAAYPRMAEFMRLKRQFDPGGRFQSDWYRHHAAMFAA